MSDMDKAVEAVWNAVPTTKECPTCVERRLRAALPHLIEVVLSVVDEAQQLADTGPSDGHSSYDLVPRDAVECHNAKAVIRTAARRIAEWCE